MTQTFATAQSSLHRAASDDLVLFVNPSRLRKLADLIADATADAYSADRYASWKGVALSLLQAGYSLEATQAILRSKWTRWAADAWSDRSPRARYGHIPAKSVIAWLDGQSGTAYSPRGAETMSLTLDSDGLVPAQELIARLTNTNGVAVCA